ncbi:MAG: GNAT family N-acetyltransferase [Armatimonadetes bacterium]|nr:GNAT family N-acetyltransferase [Armatimonadota bacterium]
MTLRKYRHGEDEKIKSLTIETFYEISIARAIEDLMGGKCGETTWQTRKGSEVQADLDANPDGVIVAEIEGEIIGYITCLIDRRSKIGWIHHIAVAALYQGKGVGKQLMEAGLDYFSSEGMQCCKIETMEHNEVGRRFYPSVGFQEVGRQIHYAMKL